MRIIKGEMWSNEQKLTLVDLLNIIPRNNWDWYIYEFEGIGKALEGLDMPSFEELILSLDNGYKISWVDLNLLAKSLHDINELFVVALEKPVSYNDVTKDNFSDFLCAIEIRDSHFWNIKIKMP